MPLPRFLKKKTYDIQKITISKNGRDKFGITWHKSSLQQGFIITSIEEGSPAANVNLKPGSNFISVECFKNDGNSTGLVSKGRKIQEALMTADVCVLDLVVTKTNQFSYKRFF